jgi:hypothetical protein
MTTFFEHRRPTDGFKSKVPKNATTGIVEQVLATTAEQATRGAIGLFIPLAVDAIETLSNTLI